MAAEERIATLERENKVLAEQLRRHIAGETKALFQGKKKGDQEVELRRLQTENDVLRDNMHTVSEESKLLRLSCETLARELEESRATGKTVDSLNSSLVGAESSLRERDLRIVVLEEQGKAREETHKKALEALDRQLRTLSATVSAFTAKGGAGGVDAMLEDTIRSLRDQVKEKSNAAPQEATAESTVQIAELSERVRATAADRDTARAALDDMRSRFTRLEADFGASQQLLRQQGDRGDFKKVEAELAQARSDRERLQRELDEKVRSMAVSSNDLVAMHQRVAALSEEASRSKRTADEASAIRRLAEIERERLLDERNNYEAQCQELSDVVVDLREACTRHEANAATVTTDIRQRDEVIVRQQEELAKFVATNSSMLATVEAQSRDRDELRRHLEQERAQCVRVKAIAAKLLADAQQSRRALAMEQSERHEERRRREEDVQLYKDRIAHLTAEVASMVTEVRELEAALARREEAAAHQTGWVDDGDVIDCQACHALFTLTVRRHHCRNCGRVYCDACSTHKAITAGHKNPVRVCDKCNDLLANKNSPAAPAVRGRVGSASHLSTVLPMSGSGLLPSRRHV